MSKRHLESWHKDKAIQDNIVESWLCVDCGVNTHPGCVSGPDLRLAFAMGAKKETVTFEDNNDDCGHRGTIAQKDLALRLIDRGSTQMDDLGEPEGGRRTQG